ncbi:hypothetical protein E4T56_gene16185 [Termitomyces sp. T112]|nr:hypothetical protein E4T56_gene16185 [Termitomyces sp. T112]KNZ80459.1 hypothetical protein J132_05579 [Termitomyces sp. J132]
MFRSFSQQGNVQTTARPSNPYPFPPGLNPSPHQIFHLPKNASEGDVKARYYELVRIYHPDKADPSISNETAHARFQSITAAYDVLRGKTLLKDSLFPSTSSPVRDFRYSTTAAWRARSRRNELYTGKDDRWKDHVILLGLVATVAILVAQVLSTRQQALSEAVARTRHPSMPQRQRAPISITTLDADNPDRHLGE